MRRDRRSQWKPGDTVVVAQRSNASSEVPTFIVQNIAWEMEAFDGLPAHWQRYLDSAPRKYSALEISRLLRRNPWLMPDDRY